MYYAVLFRKGYYILRSISPDELQKTKDKFYIAEYSFASWLNCFQIWRAFHEKNYKEIFDPLAHTFYDNHKEYKFACALRTTFTHMPCGPLSFVYDGLHETTDGPIWGVQQLLYSIIYNLCDNAIKYNHAGGCVEVAVHPDVNETIIFVKDTGIGIPEYALKTEFSYTEEVKNPRAINFVRVTIGFSEEIAKLRNKIWRTLGILRIKKDYMELVKFCCCEPLNV